MRDEHQELLDALGNALHSEDHGESVASILADIRDSLRALVRLVRAKA